MRSAYSDTGFDDHDTSERERRERRGPGIARTRKDPMNSDHGGLLQNCEATGDRGQEKTDSCDACKSLAVSPFSKRGKRVWMADRRLVGV